MSSSPRPRDWIMWSLLLSLVSVVTSLECGVNEIDLDGSRCCTVCPPGQGVVTPCSASSDTQCLPCELRYTFSSTLSHADACVECSDCSDNAHMASQCNASHDTVCECDKRYYFDASRNLCRPCDLCPVGHGAVTECSRFSNVRCRRCPNGTFSDHRSRTCVPCGVCGFHQIILRLCSNTENTICMDIPIPKLLPANATEATRQEYKNMAGKRDLLPIYCSALGLVLLGLLIYVIVSHVRRKSAQIAKQQVACSHEELPVLRAAKQGSDSGVCVEQDAKYALLSSRVQDLPYGKTSQLEIMLMASLDGRSDWRALALEIGYSPEHIANFELWASQDAAPSVRYFLSEWSQTEHATVGGLLRLLRTLGREDVVRMLQSEAMLPREPRMFLSNQEPLLV